MRQKRDIIFSVVWLLFQLLLPVVAHAQQTSSSHYQVNEVQFGSGGSVNNTSSHYQSQTSAGSLGGGTASSTNFTAHSGFLTQNEDYLELGVISGTVDLGDLTTVTTSHGSGSFYVRAYTGSGYTIQTVSNPPSNATGNILKAKTTLGAVSPGVEEFGMNLVANPNFCGSGCNLGADPVQYPDSSYAAGVAASGYDTPNQFKYVPGDTIASAPKGNGQTNFTASFIADITGVTPAGVYQMEANFVVVASY